MTAARWRAGGRRSPGLASPSAIARRICAATCSCRRAGSSRSILTSSIVPVIVAHQNAGAEMITDPPAEAPDAGVIEEAGARQRRQRAAGAAIALVVAAVVGILAGFSGS